MDFEGSLPEYKVVTGPGEPPLKFPTSSKPSVLSSQDGFDLVDMFASSDVVNCNDYFTENSWTKVHYRKDIRKMIHEILLESSQLN